MLYSKQRNIFRKPKLMIKGWNIQTDLNMNEISSCLIGNSLGNQCFTTTWRSEKQKSRLKIHPNSLRWLNPITLIRTVLRSCDVELTVIFHKIVTRQSMVQFVIFLAVHWHNSKIDKIYWILRPSIPSPNHLRTITSKN